MRVFVSLLIVAILISHFIGHPAAASSHKNFYYLSPLPGAELVSRETTLLFRPSDALRMSSWTASVRVRGKMSGVHTGDWVVSDDGQTTIFKPHSKFEPGERVTVSIGSVGEGIGTAFSYDFTVSPKRAEREFQRIHPFECDCFGSPGSSHGVLDPGRSAPAPNRAFELPPDFPPITVTVNDNPASGQIFASNFAFDFFMGNPGASYLMILDNTGFPEYFKKVPSIGLDFKKQPNGLLTYFVFQDNKYYAMDNTYTVVDTFWAQGFQSDIHDVQLITNDHYLIMGIDFQTVDMSQIVVGGDTAATVLGLIVQEVDSGNNVVFEWRSWDHFEITDAVNTDLTLDRIDYVHQNSIELDNDGHIIISNRHMDEVTKINRQTGDIIWRMGGKNNDFTLVGDTLWFSWQHSARRIANGNLTLFDNGDFNDPQESRALEYMVDETNMIVTLVRQYRNNPPIYGGAMGNTQRLPDGNWIVGWGSTNPNVTEVRPDGTVAFEMTFADQMFSYRAFRHDWTGVAAAPYLWPDTTGGQVELHFTKFGDPNVDEYNIYQGTDPSPTTLVGTTTGNSYLAANTLPVTSLYFRVTAVDMGNESPFSNEIEVIADTTKVAVLFAGIRAILVDDAVRLTWALSYDEEITGLRVYRREESTVFEPLVSLSVDAREFVDVTVTPGHSYTYTVTAVAADGSEVPSPPVQIRTSRAALYLGQNHPNPFNPTTTITYSLDKPAHATIRIYDLRGALVTTLDAGVQEAGVHDLIWDGRNAAGNRVSTGTYFYMLEAGGRSLSRKMLLLK